jgi:D-hexose-6-phosphate mutarotase
MDIELFSGSTKAIIDPEGAWLTNLSDEYGDVLFPKRLLRAPDGSKKVRGGCHVCLPNFGPGGESGLSQHGFARTLSWKVQSQTGDTVKLELAGGEGEYASLRVAMTYRITGRELSMVVALHNEGVAPLRVAPAFHPYISVPHGTETVRIDNKMIRYDDLAEAVFIEHAGDLSVETGQRKLTLAAEGLAIWAQWTDMLGSYVCVEPTLGGFSFLQPAKDAEILAPGELKTVAMTLRW